MEDYPITAGDLLVVEIEQLRQRGAVYQAQVKVSPLGKVNLPIVGRVKATGQTVPEFERTLSDALRDRDILVEPSVVVNPLFQHQATYSVFGIGVSAANNAPLRAGIRAIPRPDFRVLEAINDVGGLNEYVTEVYVFRTFVPDSDGAVDDAAEDVGQGSLPIESAGDEVEEEPEESTLEDESIVETSRSAELELLEAVTAPGSDADEISGTPTSEPADIPGGLEPDPTQPFVWDNVAGEFVRNPAFQAPAPEPVPARTEPPPTSDTASPTVNWARIAGDTAYRILRIPAESLRAGEPDANIFVRPGDTIRIVSGEIGIYYVMGQVNRVGAFSFGAESITLKAAIAAAGGLSPLAWPDRCTVYRRLGQREQMIQVNLDRIFAGKDSDFLIRRGDIINVGTHPFAPFLQRIRQWTLPTPASNVGYSFTYARNFADIDSYAVQRNPANEPDKFPNFFP